MRRFAILAAYFAVGSSGLVSLAADPIPDPDAKGTVVVTSIGKDKMSIVVKVATTVAQNCTVGKVQAFAMKTNGNYIHGSADAVVDPTDGMKWTATIADVPNGTYFVWAVSEIASGNDFQRVGSSVTPNFPINNTPDAPAVPNGALVNYSAGFPKRQMLGAQIVASGTVTVTQPTYQLAGTDPVVLAAIPVQGGLVREGLPVVPPPAGAIYNWNNASILAPAAFEHNILARARLTPKAGQKGPSYEVGAAWVKK